MMQKSVLTAAIVAAFSVLASTNATAVTVTGSPSTNSGPGTGLWTFELTGSGTLDITLVEADYSEWFEWSLTGPVSGGDAFSPHTGSDPTVTLNTSLGSWSATAGLYTFSADNFAHAGNVFTVDFAFTADPGTGSELVNLDPPPGGMNPVPVPAAVWLFGSGLLGLAGFARRQKN